MSGRQLWARAILCQIGDLTNAFVAEREKIVDIFKRDMLGATFAQEASTDSHSLQYVMYSKHATGIPALP